MIYFIYIIIYVITLYGKLLSYEIIMIFFSSKHKNTIINLFFHFNTRRFTFYICIYV